ncbi:translocation/assembly module TamB domain-containing protein [Nitrosomonas sp. Nm166]|uniref:translocation/assembly module TamB domain-containing protein n=1 Tax=Nitrosomonas sp. Nm166 TaxID=1881054 RepID=UPI0008EC68FC|nr:translocation/assembly module TamB domain-containing protein [Nitrosomonas sp. Nm166]SFE52902.1 translocation and assembly module TamB [Nitrosomonas sp. Nm166]
MTNHIHNNQTLKNKKYNWLISLVFALLFSVSIVGYWLLNSQSGLQWAFSMINRLSSGVIQFEEVRGTLRNMHITNVHFSSDEFQLVMRNIHVSWHPGELLQERVNIHQLSVETMAIHTRPSTTPAPQRTLPDHLQIPLAISIHALQVNSIRLTSAENEDSEFIISDLALSLESDGHYHRLNNLNFHTPWGAFHIQAELNGDSPFDVSAYIDLSDADPWGDTQAAVTGNLEQMNIQISAKQSAPKRDLYIQLQPFAANPVAQLHAMLEKLNPAGFLADAPNASLSVTADLITNQSGQLEGKIVVENQATTVLNDGGLPFSAISTQAFITSEFLKLQDIRARIGANEILRGDLMWRMQEQSGSAHLLINQLNPQRIDSRIRAAQVSGQIDLVGNVQAQSARINLKDHSVGLNAAVTRSGERITLEQFNLQRSKSQLNGQGKLDLGNAKTFELSGHLANFNIADFIEAPDSNLNAAINLSGQLAPQISGVLKYVIQKSRLAKSLVAGAGQIAFSGFERFKGKAELKVGSNHFLAQGSIGEPRDSFQFTLNAPTLEHVGFGLAGDLQAYMTLSGNLKLPDFALKLKSRQLRLPGDQLFSGLTADGRLQNEVMSFKLAIDRYAAGEKARVKHLIMNVDGKTSDHTLFAKAQINNDIQIQLKTTGGIDRKTQSPRWQGQLIELSSVGKIPVRLMAPTAVSISPEFVSFGHARFSISDGFMDIDQLQWTPKNWKTQGHFSSIGLLPGEHAELKQHSLHFRGYWNFVSDSQLTGNLQIQREKGDWSLLGELSPPLGLETLQLQVAAQNGKITGTFELFSKLIGSANAHLTIPTKSSNNGWSIPNEAPLNGEVIAHITNLKWMDSILGGDIRTDGQLQIQANIKGTLNQPDFEGTATGKELSVLLLEQGIDLQHGALTAKFHQSDLQIDQLRFITPHKAPPDNRLSKELKLDGTSGSLTITGSIGLTGNESYLDFKINQLPLTHKTDYWIIASGSGQARLHKNVLNLRGDLRTDAGLLQQPPEDRPELPEDVVLVNNSPQDTTQQNFSVLLDISVDLGEKFYLRVSGLEGRLTGRLKVQNDQKNKLKVNGSIATKETTFKAYGQNLTVRRGIVNFNGPLDDPGLNILAVREGLPVEAGIEIMGSVRHPQVKLVSAPNVPDNEKLSWIVLGRKPDAGGLDTSVLLSAAGVILGGRSGGGVTEQLTRALGVDEISFKQAGVGSPLSGQQPFGSPSSGQQVAVGSPLSGQQIPVSSSLGGQIGVIGKRISSRAYLSYERGLMATTMGITKLTYNLTPKITVVTQTGEDNAIDLFYTFQFD